MRHLTRIEHYIVNKSLIIFAISRHSLIHRLFELILLVNAVSKFKLNLRPKGNIDITMVSRFRFVGILHGFRFVAISSPHLSRHRRTQFERISISERIPRLNRRIIASFAHRHNEGTQTNIRTKTNFTLLPNLFRFQHDVFYVIEGRLLLFHKKLNKLLTGRCIIEVKDYAILASFNFSATLYTKIGVIIPLPSKTIADTTRQYCITSNDNLIIVF